MAEAMAVQTEYAGLWRRYSALSFDMFWIVGWGFPIVVILTGTRLGWPLYIAYPLLCVAYFVALESSPLQATLGKLLVGISVTDSEGGRISFLRSLLRNAVKYVLFSIPVVNFLFAMAGFTERKRGPHDMLTGTLVERSDGAGMVRALSVLVASFVVLFVGMSVFKKTFDTIMKATDEMTASEKGESSPPPVPAKPAPKPVVEEKAQAVPPVAPSREAVTRQVPVTAPPVRAESRPAKPAPAESAKPRAKARESECVFKPVMTDEDLAKCR